MFKKIIAIVLLACFPVWAFAALPGIEWILFSLKYVDLSGNSVTDLNDVTSAGSGQIITSAERSKLNSIERNADVTDATNVSAAGAVMDGDFISNGLLKRTSSGNYTVISDNSSNWDAAYALTDSFDVMATQYDLTQVSVSGMSVSAFQDSINAYRTSYKLDTAKIDTTQWGNFVRDHQSSASGSGDFQAASFGDSLTNYDGYGVTITDNDAIDADTSQLATQYDITNMIAWSDTNVITTINDTISTLASQYDLTQISGTGISLSAFGDSMNVYRTAYKWDTTKIDTTQWGNFVRDHQSAGGGSGDFSAASFGDSLTNYDGYGITITDNDAIDVDSSALATQYDISDMATQTWTNAQGYLTSETGDMERAAFGDSLVNYDGYGITITDNDAIDVDSSALATQYDISDMATQTWTNAQGFLTSETGDMERTAFGDSLTNYDGDGVKIIDNDAIDLLLESDKGLQVVSDSLGIKLDGSTLSLSASGLKVNSVSGITGADEDNVSLADVQTATSSDFHNIGGTDDDVPEAGDFGAATDLDANGALNIGSVDANELASTAVTPGSYTSSSITVDADGRITAASTGSAYEPKFWFTMDYPVGAVSDTLWGIYENTSGSSITIDSIYVETDYDSFYVKLVKKDWAGGNVSLIDSINTTVAGVNMFYKTETTLTNGTIGTGQKVGFVRPVHTASYMAIRFHYH